MDNILGLVFTIILFINCILSIDLYRSSYCYNKSECESSIRIVKNGTQVLNISGVCGSSKDRSKDNPIFGEFIVSTLILCISIIIYIVAVLLDIDNIYNPITILVFILNIIVSSMTIDTWRKCTGGGLCTVDDSYITDKINKFKKINNLYSTKCLYENSDKKYDRIITFIGIVLASVIVLILPYIILN